MVGSLKASRTDTVKAAAKGWTNDRRKVEVIVNLTFKGCWEQSQGVGERDGNPERRIGGADKQRVQQRREQAW